jgi:pimeloyl-ACP methyl ester carboxylesterase
MPVSRKLRIASTGLEHHLLEWDGGGDHTVLLLHGFADNAWSWELMMQTGIGARLHVVAPDLRGYGDTDWIGPGGYYHFIDHLVDVHALVQACGRQRVSIVGHSMGGSVAGYYAGSYPERVHRLALLEGLGPPETTDAMPDRVRAWIDAWERTRARPPRSYASLAEAAARLREHDPLLTAELAERLAVTGTVVEDGRYRFKHDPLHVTPGPWGFSVAVARQFWSRIRCPTLLVEGGESLFRPLAEEHARRAAHIAGARQVTLPSAGHMMQRHQPVALAKLLTDFLQEEG